MSIREVQIIAGANGTGKTTFARGIVKDTGLPFLNADDIASKMASGADLGEVRLDAGREFLKQIEAALTAKKSFLLETTLSGRYLIGLVSRFRAEGYRTSIRYLFLDSAEEAIRRIQVRVRLGGHDVPEEDVLRRFLRSKRNFWNIYRQIVDSWEVFYSCWETFVHVAIGKEHQHEVLDEEGFRIFMEGI